MLNVGLDLAGRVHVVCCMSYIALCMHGCYLRSNFMILLNVVFESPVGLRLALIRGSRRSVSCTVLMLFTDLVVRHLPDFSVAISVLASPMCRIFRKIPQNRLGTWRLSVWRSFFKTLNYSLWTSSASQLS